MIFQLEQTQHSFNAIMTLLLTTLIVLTSLNQINEVSSHINYNNVTYPVDIMHTHRQKQQQQQHHHSEWLWKGRHRHQNHHMHDYFVDDGIIYETNASVSSHGRKFYWRHKRKYHEMDVSTELLHWPIKKEAIVEGQVILGGLMMVHEREEKTTCGPIMPQGGIQALEAMLYTLDWINEQKFLPDITLGAHILDDCDKDTRGLEMAVDFIRGEFIVLLTQSYNHRLNGIVVLSCLSNSRIN